MALRRFLIVLWCAIIVADCHQVSMEPRLTTTTAYKIYQNDDVSNSSLIHGSRNRELELYKARVKILYHLLRAECRTLKPINRVKRDIAAQVSETHHEVEVILFETMTKMLIECRRRNLKHKITGTSIPESTATTGTTTEPVPPSTASAVPQPPECQNAINLTDNWRRDHLGSKFLPSGTVNCDLNKMIASGRPWFRFAGAAGNRMLNVCAPDHSCGTHGAIWTDALMPSLVGPQVHVDAYISWTKNCKLDTRKISVIRCSLGNAHDFVYKLLSTIEWCSSSFCSMTSD